MTEVNHYNRIFLLIESFVKNNNYLRVRLSTLNNYADLTSL